MLALLLFPPAGYAAGHEVLVVDVAYKPAATQIQAGDTVVWRWDSENARSHTVTAIRGGFDSDSDQECANAAQCRAPGRVFQWKFTQPGIYPYRCKVHAVMLGRVEVAEPAPPQQSPPAEPTPAPPSAADRQRPQQSAPQRSALAPPAQPPARTGQPPPRARMAAVPGMTYARVPVAPPAPRTIAPAVAPPRDPLRILAEARPAPIVPEAPAEHPGQQLAVEVPAGQSGPRTGLVVGIAVATLLATAGAFSKVVLFKRPWS